MDYYNKQRTQWDQDRQYDRRSWSEEDWARGLKRALKPKSRASGNIRGAWEYLVNGNWVPQAMYDDQKWRENVFQPWQEGVQDTWRMDREKADKWNRENKNPSYMLNQRQPRKQYRSPGGIGNRSTGGGGMTLDPAILDALMSGG